MALDTTKTLTGVKYNGVAFPLDDGKDMLQARVDATNSCEYLFYGYKGTKLPDISRLDTSNATSMQSMFASCNYLTELDLSNFDTSNVTSMYNMFYQNDNLTTLDLSSFDTSKVTAMGAMFQSCVKLQKLDLSNFNTANVINMNSLIWGNSRLTTIQGTLDLYSLAVASNIFHNTRALTGVTLKNIRISLQIGSGTQYGHLWELPYLINAVKELWNYADSGTQYTLTIGSANLEKIANTYVKLITATDEMIAADPYINDKLPCEECASTDEGAITLTAYAGLKNWVLD
jgi:surface protein